MKQYNAFVMMYNGEPCCFDFISTTAEGCWEKFCGKIPEEKKQAKIKAATQKGFYVKECTLVEKIK